MADPFSIIGLIGVTTQIIQIGTQLGSDWKEAPADAKRFMTELRSLKTALSETHANILLNKDLQDAFQGRHSTLLAELGPSAQNTTTQVLVSECKTELDNLLEKLGKRDRGHRLGWERVKGAFVAKTTRDAIENLQRQCQVLNNMVSMDALTLNASIYREVKESRIEQERAKDDQRHREILDWLTPVDYAPQQSDFIHRRQPGTGQWVLDSAEFQAWVEANTQTLFCPGIPGAGKTILTSIVVDELTTRFGHDNSIGIAYIYCNFRRRNKQNAVDLLASVLKQLSQRASSLPDHVQAMYDKHKDKQARPSLAEIERTLQFVAAMYTKVYVVVDALDECQTSDGCRTKFLEEIFNLQAQSGVNLFATSRSLPEIVQGFGQRPHLSLEIRASEEDIERYLDGHMKYLSGFNEWDQQLREDIKKAILDAVDGMCVFPELSGDWPLY